MRSHLGHGLADAEVAVVEVAGRGRGDGDVDVRRVVELTEPALDVVDGIGHAAGRLAEDAQAARPP